MKKMTSKGVKWAVRRLHFKSAYRKLLKSFNIMKFIALEIASTSTIYRHCTV